MTGYDSLDNGKADTGSFILVCAMKPLENPKEFISLGHVESNTVILYIIDDLAAAARGGPPGRVPRRRR